MKVLFINEVCGTGSTGRICTDLAIALEKQGHEVKIAYGRDGSVPEEFQRYAVRIGTDWDVRLHAIKTRLFDAAGFGSIKATKKFIAWVEAYDPDIIHLHNLHGYYINIELLFQYLKSCNKRIIWTLHDCWAFTGHSAYCDAVRCERWKTGCYKCPQKKVYPKSYVDASKKNWIRKRALFSGIPNMAIITPSYWLANLVRESYLKEYQVMVIHNGIDISNFYPLANDFKEVYNLVGKTIILSVATVWNDLKGYHDFLKLASILNDTYRIVMVGGMTEEQIKELPKNIIHINKTRSIKEMAYLYNAADVYVNLTVCDTYPTVNLEAVACGTPVITYDVGGSAENARAYGGIVVKRGDMDTIVKLLADAPKRKDAFKVPEVGELNKQTTIISYVQRYDIPINTIGGIRK